MRIAIVHYWLVSMRGGERVLEALCEMFPEADIFTHVVDRAAISPTIAQHTIHTSFIQKLPAARRLYRHYLPLMPMALELLDLSAYDLVISSEAGPAKGVITRPDAVHICYCHSPMRYLWDQHAVYRRAAGPIQRLAMAAFSPRLRLWDAMTALRVDSFVANSAFVAQRIRRYYGCGSVTIHPPVRIDTFEPTGKSGGDYLCLGQIVPYKRIDLVIEAFRTLDRRLIIAGDGGADQARLAARAPDNVTFLGRQSEDAVRALLGACRALILPGEEDFGIVPVEAMASGRPVIAYGVGGARATVIDGKTGLFFAEQTTASLRDAIVRFEAMEHRFDAGAIRAHAERFDTAHFKRAFRAHVDDCLDAARDRVARAA
ncbi:glycosyltransferase [Kaistia dalseonensis]|uniref:Glycosyltransferase involved in cell wall biosynthesis n=1 Tax=Kaistia dalseonensis TaxID=410840 RepID=A0ABU0HCY2_9HYPH|nr:glycosyltransferase [Kaistia dalseonensis]MCX5497544.1 glycosyltransferase [Kaistia dalseonensis]MDQ0440184.1 glycosyltransferase involved in cell wall biosynthesis [Kaistia dalseonensis]